MIINNEDDMQRAKDFINKSNILEQLNKYFKNTPKEEIEAAWKKSEEECKSIDSPTIKEYLLFLNEINPSKTKTNNYETIHRRTSKRNF